MLLKDYPYTTGEDLPYCDKNSFWNLLHSYIAVYSQRLIDYLINLQEMEYKPS